MQSTKDKESKKHEHISKQKRPSSEDAKDRSKDAGHFKYKIGDVMKDRYEVWVTVCNTKSNLFRSRIILAMVHLEGSLRCMITSKNVNML